MIIEALRKMKFNREEKGLVSYPPNEIRKDIMDAGLEIDFNCDNDRKYPFVLTFFFSNFDVEQYGIHTLNSVSEDGMLWMAYPKKSSKLYSDLTRDSGWSLIQDAGWVGVSLIAIDDDWSAMRYIRSENVGKKTSKKPAPKNSEIAKVEVLEAPEDFLLAVSKNASALATFDHLAPSYRKLYINWITSAKRHETRMKRIEEAVIKLANGQRDPNNNNNKKC